MKKNQLIEAYKTLTEIKNTMADCKRLMRWNNIVSLTYDCRRIEAKIEALEN
jgi:hypothetical protein